MVLPSTGSIGTGTVVGSRESPPPLPPPPPPGIKKLVGAMVGDRSFGITVVMALMGGGVGAGGASES